MNITRDRLSSLYFFLLFMLSLILFTGDCLALEPGAILYRTSGGGDMPGRVREPLPGSVLTNPYLQVPCDVYKEAVLGGLKTGHVGLVVKLNDEHRMKPVVMLVMDRDKKYIRRGL